MTTGQELRDKGAEMALNAERDAYAIELAIRRTAKRFMEFSSDQVWDELESMGVYAFDHRNAFGAQFLAQARYGVIENTGRVLKSHRPSAHSRAVAVWKSLTHKDKRPDPPGDEAFATPLFPEGV